MFSLLIAHAVYAEERAEQDTEENEQAVENGDAEFPTSEAEEPRYQVVGGEEGLGFGEGELPTGIYPEKDVGRWEYRTHVQTEQQLQHEYRAFRDYMKREADEN